jgi:hypothetical protein
MVTIVGLRRSFGLQGDTAGDYGRPPTGGVRTRIAARLRESPATLTIALVVAALVSALLEQLITVATGGWSWIAFAQSGMKNVAFALLLAGVVALGRAQRTPQAASVTTDPPPPRPQVSTDELVRELSDITDVAGELGLMPEAGHPYEYWDDAFEYLDSIRWSLANYVLRGDRTRRLVNAPNLSVGLADGDGPNLSDLSLAAHTLRTRADELADQVRYTNTVVSDWLVAHRVAVPNPCYLDSNVLFDRCRSGHLDPNSIAEDPLYLLVCHMHDVLETVEHTGGGDDAVLKHMRAQLTLPLRAVQQEVVAAMAYGAAAIGMTRAVVRTPRT